MDIRLAMAASIVRQSVYRLSAFVMNRGRSLLLILLLLSFIGCDSSDEQEEERPINSRQNGFTVSLAWDAVQDSGVLGYYIHYGKRSPHQIGSCAYDDQIFVASNYGIVTHLDPGLTYYFAVSAYNGLDSSCSNEVFVHTPSIDCCPP